MPDRSWERGLHQLVETKEGCEPTARRETIARITYQRLFRRFIRLGGMTGTGKEVSPEIRHVYGLDMVRVPLNRPSRRRHRRPRTCLTKVEKWRYRRHGRGGGAGRGPADPDRHAVGGGLG